mgnify:CR=1 FL=1
MRKNYNYNKLTSVYESISESASLKLKREMFKEECWDRENDRPVMECWTESGDIKEECWASAPGGTNSIDGGAIADARRRIGISEKVKK